MTGDIEAILETGTAAAVEVTASALANRGRHPETCANCGRPLVGPYCAFCGQAHNVHRGSLHHLARDFVEDLASFDSRILRTARALVLSPGELPRAFYQGRTQGYVPAMRLYLFVSLLFFLFLSATGIAFVQFTLSVHGQKFVADRNGNVSIVADGKSTPMSGFKADKDGAVYVAGDDGKRLANVGFKAYGEMNYTVTSLPMFFQRVGDPRLHIPPAVKAALDRMNVDEAKDTKSQTPGWVKKYVFGTLQKLETNPAALNAPLTAWLPRILFLLLPLYALILTLFYWGKRKQFFFVDHLVFSLTAHSFVFVLLIVAAIAAQVLPGGLVAIATVLALGTYLILSLKRFYGQGWLATGLKFGAMSAIYFFFLLGPAMLAAITASIVVG